MSKKALIAVIVLFIAFCAMDFVIHQIVLADLYAETAALWRPEGEMKMGLMFLVVFIATVAFVYIYDRFFAAKGVRTGLLYGLVFGIGTGVGMGYGTYAVMPLPYMLALGWFLGSVVEATVAGALLGAIVKE